MRFSQRRLLGNSTSRIVGSALSNVQPTPTAAQASATNKNVDAVVVSHSKQLAARHALSKDAAKKRNNKVPAVNLSEGVSIETADVSSQGINVDTNISDISVRSYLTPVLDEFIPNMDANPYIPPVYLYNIYRDIYYHDSISGGAVDMMEKLAFSDFNLSGLDDKQLVPFHESIDAMRVRRLLPQLSTEYLTHGMYAAQMQWDEDKKRYTSIIPHNPSFTYVKPHPVFGHDPQVSVDFAGAMREIGGTDGNNRNRIAKIEIDGVPQAMLENNRFVIPLDDLVYMTRGGLAKDVRGVSYLKRVLPIWLFEKLLIRGTIDQASKRQRGIPHMQVGDEDWVPTSDDMRMLAEMYSNAALDPVGAVFITRKGVDVSEISRGDDFWKWPDIYDFTSQAKMRALGINEAILSGDASLNTMDMAMSVFIEAVRSHRDAITYEVFYERMFPRIAVANNIRAKRKEKAAWEENASEIAKIGGELGRQPRGVFETASSFKEFTTKHAYPRLNWHKRLRPEADEAYLNVLTILKDNGLPIPLAMWAASGGMDIDSLLAGMQDDIKKRQSVKDWAKTAAPLIEGEEGGGNEEASVRPSMKRIGLMNRDYSALEEVFGVVNRTGDGKRKPLSARGKKDLEEKVLRRAAEAAAEIAKRENAKIKAGK